MFKKKCRNMLVMFSVLTLFASITASPSTFNTQAENSGAIIIDPIAKYEFKDATNHGKDSMGNYDLEFARYWVSGGTGELMNDGEIDTVNGGVTFGGNQDSPTADNPGYCLTNMEGADVFDEVSAFTLAFEFQNHIGSATWATLIGWGNGDRYLGLQDMADSDDLNNIGFNCYGTSAGTIWGNAWFQNCGAVNGSAGTTYQKMLISAQPGGQLSVYVNGKSWLNYELASDWAINDTAVQFAIGAAYNGTGAYSASGAIRNVQVYDFAMDSTAAIAYQTNGVLTTDDLINLDENSGVVGATIRLTENSGLRFLATLNEEVVEKYSQVYGAENVSFGMKLVRNHNGTTAYAYVPATNKTLADGAYSFNAVVTGLTAEYYATEYTAQVYISFTKNGQMTYVLPTAEEEAVTRSISGVAKAALTDTYTVGTDGTLEEKSADYRYEISDGVWSPFSETTRTKLSVYVVE